MQNPPFRQESLSKMPIGVLADEREDGALSLFPLRFCRGYRMKAKAGAVPRPF